MHKSPEHANRHFMKIKHELPQPSPVKDIFVIDENENTGIGTGLPLGKLSVVESNKYSLNIKDNKVSVGTSDIKGSFYVADDSSSVFLVKDKKVAIGTSNTSAVFGIAYDTNTAPDKVFEIKESSKIFKLSELIKVDNKEVFKVQYK